MKPWVEGQCCRGPCCFSGEIWGNLGARNIFQGYLPVATWVWKRNITKKHMDMYWYESNIAVTVDLELVSESHTQVFPHTVNKNTRYPPSYRTRLGEDEWCVRICFGMPNTWRKITTNPWTPKSISSFETTSNIYRSFLNKSSTVLHGQKINWSFPGRDRPWGTYTLELKASLFTTQAPSNGSMWALFKPSAAWPASPIVTSLSRTMP